MLSVVETWQVRSVRPMRLCDREFFLFNFFLICGDFSDKTHMPADQNTQLQFSKSLCIAGAAAIRSVVVLHAQQVSGVFCA